MGWGERLVKKKDGLKRRIGRGEGWIEEKDGLMRKMG